MQKNSVGIALDILTNSLQQQLTQSIFYPPPFPQRFWNEVPHGQINSDCMWCWMVQSGAPMLICSQMGLQSSFHYHFSEQSHIPCIFSLPPAVGTKTQQVIWSFTNKPLCEQTILQTCIVIICHFNHQEDFSFLTEVPVKRPMALKYSLD